MKGNRRWMWRLPTRRKSRVLSAADAAQYNARETMRCVETRPCWAWRHASGPGGTRAATTLARVELAQRTAPSIGVAAYLAQEEGTQRHIEMLIDTLERIIRSDATKEGWRYHDPDATKLRALASIIVEQWLHPGRYWRHDGTRGAYISAFAVNMGCDRKTWRATWQRRFERYRAIPLAWYEIGKFTIEGM